MSHSEVCPVCHGKGTVPSGFYDMEMLFCPQLTMQRHVDRVEGKDMSLSLISRAKEAIVNKEDSFEWGLEVKHVNTAKIDVDVKLDEDDMMAWKISRDAMLYEMALYPIEILIDRDVKDDERRGFHAVIHYLSDGELSDEAKNLMELLLGGDVTRFEINRRRLEKGISMGKASILFSEILERFPMEECERCGLKRAMEEFMKKNEI